jgi:guanylate kinase
LSERLPNVIVVSAPSGVGKSTVLARVVETRPGLRFSVSHTTRPPRPGEMQGVHYHFVDRPAFEKLVGEGRFLEHAQVHGHLYGTSVAEYEAATRERKDLLLDLDVQGARYLRGHFPDVVTIFILPPSYTDLVGRIRGRAQDDADVIARRLEAAEEEMKSYREYDYALVNDNLERCAATLATIIEATQYRTSRMEPEGQKVLGTFPKRRIER